MQFLLFNQCIDKPDHTKMKKIFLGLSKEALCIAGLGFVMNLYLKRIPCFNFLALPFYQRFLIRTPVFISPYLLFHKDIQSKYQEMQAVWGKYAQRLYRFKKTGDIN